MPQLLSMRFRVRLPEMIKAQRNRTHLLDGGNTQERIASKVNS